MGWTHQERQRAGEDPARVVNWRTFYDLPKVKPMRIRVGGQVVPQLIHHINPIPQSDALHQQVLGTVVVHAVIDRDGNVVQLEPISGPPELINAAVEAARQWPINQRFSTATPWK
jgi:outer membrane biosynthesis protein TonB